MIDIIIVNYKSSSHLKRCLTSIYSSIDINRLNVIVIDNNSNDGCKKMPEYFPEIKIRFNSRNVGFAAAVNQGLRISYSPYAMLLNPDTIIGNDLFEKLTTFLEKRPRIGIVGPRIEDPSGDVQGSARKFPDALTALFGRTSFLTRFFPVNRTTRSNIKTLENDGRTPQDVDWISGACMMVRREAIEQVGMLDERFFMYWEDADWCRRMWEKGWKVVYYPKAPVVHHVGASSEHRVLRSTYDFHKSAYLLYEKYADPHLIFLKPLVFGALYFRFLSLVSLRRIKSFLGHSK